MILAWLCRFELYYNLPAVSLKLHVLFLSKIQVFVHLLKLHASDFFPFCKGCIYRVQLIICLMDKICNSRKTAN